VTIRGRISKLEGSAASHDCLHCGYPRTGVHRVVVRPDASPLPTCPKCGQPLDDDGVPLHTLCKRIILEHPELV
jgi:NAD-dependent SIR2 family protein deacetylase